MERRVLALAAFLFPFSCSNGKKEETPIREVTGSFVAPLPPLAPEFEKYGDEVQAIIASNALPGRLYAAGFRHGLLESGDWGESFVSINGDLPGRNISALGLDERAHVPVLFVGLACAGFHTMPDPIEVPVR